MVGSWQFEEMPAGVWTLRQTFDSSLRRRATESNRGGNGQASSLKLAV